MHQDQSTEHSRPVPERSDVSDHEHGGSKTSEADRQRNAPAQVEQDNRVAKAVADAKAAGGGPTKPEEGLNRDG